MNEPHDLDVATWAESVQVAVNAIRAAGATNYLLLPGSNYTSAQYFPTVAGPYLLNVTDPLGGTERLIFDGECASSLGFVRRADLWWACSPQVPRLRQQRDPR